jgi:hypothetical protein
LSSPPLALHSPKTILLVIEPGWPWSFALWYCRMISTVSQGPRTPLPASDTHTGISHGDLRPLFLPHVSPNRRHSSHHNRARASNDDGEEVCGLVDGRPAQVAQRSAEEERGGWGAGHDCGCCNRISRYNRHVYVAKQTYMYSFATRLSMPQLPRGVVGLDCDVVRSSGGCTNRRCAILRHRCWGCGLGVAYVSH